MKRLFLILALLASASPVSAQGVTRLASQQASGNLATNGDVIALPVPQGVGFGSVGVEVSGTWTGTIEVQCAASLAGGTFVALELAPRNSTILVTSFTANGQWVGSIAGCQRVRATATAAMTGSAQVTMVGNFTASLPVLFRSDFPTQLFGPTNCTTAPAYSFTGDGNTGYGSSGADALCLVTGGTARASLSTTALTLTVPTLAPDGSASAPSYSFASAPTYGMYLDSGTNLRFATAGGFRGQWTANGLDVVDNLRLGSSTDVSLSRGAAGQLNSNSSIARTGANGQLFNDLQSLTELTTIAAAATTDTTIQMPAGAVVLAVSVRTTVTIPTATSYTVGDSGSAARFNTANVGVAANSTDAGTKAGAYYNASALAIRLTMVGGTPANNAGRVRVTIYYYTVTPPTS